MDERPNVGDSAHFGVVKMRARCRVDHITKHRGQETVTFVPVTTGKPEHNTFAKYAPNGSLTLTITNPGLVGSFEPEDEFFVDFTSVSRIGPTQE